MDARDKAQTAKTAAENARESAENSEANAKTYKESAAESAATAQQYSGKPPKPENGTWWIWDAEKGTYVNTTISCELTGPTGNGIQSIQLTQGNHTPGSTDIYTVTMTDGSEYNIAVYNGLNGTLVRAMCSASISIWCCRPPDGRTVPSLWRRAALWPLPSTNTSLMRMGSQP